MPYSGKKPRKLARSGSDLWDAIADNYELRPDEARLLEDAAREADLITRLEDALSEASLISTGSMGQEVSSPLVSEIRQHRATLSGLLKSLKLPDATETARTRANNDSDAARSAARKRWDKRVSAQ